jgi:hypothetical protein
MPRLWRDPCAAAHRVDGGERALALTGFDEVVEQFGNGGAFVGLLWN